MKLINWNSALIVGALFTSSCAFAAGLLTPSNATYQELQIKTHDVHVVVQDGYSRTQVEQGFFNPNQHELEAIYRFPVPEGAAVGEFSYWINGLEVNAEVVEKQQAKAIYEEQKQAGKHSALVEKDSYKHFEVKVFPIPAQDEVKIRLVYLQKEAIDTGLGRYVYPLEEGGVDPEQDSFWKRNDAVKERFSFTMDIRSSVPIDAVRLPGHSSASISTLDPQQWQVSISEAKKTSNEQGTKAELALDEQIALKEAQQVGELQSGKQTRLDKDIVVYWRHQPDISGSVDLLSYREQGKQQGTFMLTLSPGDDLALNAGQRDWIFVLDKSGSMQGKYESLVEGVRQGLSKLPSGDRFRIITFNRSAQDITGGYQNVSPQAVEASMEALIKNGVDGGTNLYAGVAKALKSLDSDRASAIVLVSDGVANVGITEKKAFLKLLDKKDVRLYSFIMGNSANRPLLEGMSKVSNGFYASISNADDLMGQVMLATSKMTHQAMRDIKVDIDGVKVTELSHDNFNSLYRGQQLSVFGHYFGQGRSSVTLTGVVNGQKVKYETEVNFKDVEELHPEIERLWAFSKIKHLEEKMDYLGEDADIQQAIQDIAVQYGLVTNYTSLIVVEEEVFKEKGIKQRNKQRVAKERKAQQYKQQQAVVDNRADHNKPMFSSSRPSFGGGGAVNPFIVLGLLLIVAIRRKC